MGDVASPKKNKSNESEAEEAEGAERPATQSPKRKKQLYTSERQSGLVATYDQQYHTFFVMNMASLQPGAK